MPTPTHPTPSAAHFGGPWTKRGVPVLATRYKTQLCRTFATTGSCRYGAECMFAHGAEELRSKARNVANGLVNAAAVRGHQLARAGAGDATPPQPQREPKQQLHRSSRESPTVAQTPQSLCGDGDAHSPALSGTPLRSEQDEEKDATAVQAAGAPRPCLFTCVPAYHPPLPHSLDCSAISGRGIDHLAASSSTSSWLPSADGASERYRHDPYRAAAKGPS